MPREITIVHVPRERYSGTETSLNSILEHTQDVPYELLILDAGSPPHIQQYLRKVADAEDHRQLVRFDFILTPNELRNEAIQRVNTPYILFIDNDAVVTPGWLPPLLKTAKEHNAWVVGPTVLIGDVAKQTVHLAGGDCEVIEENGERHYSYLNQRFCDRHLPEIRDQLAVGCCTCIEFHCMLVRRDVFDVVGLLDEDLMSFAECDDFSMKVTQAGGTLYYTPESTVTYFPPKGSDIPVTDLEYFLLRWSNEWNERSLDTFSKTWRLTPGHHWIDVARWWPKLHRRRALKYLAWPFGRISKVIERCLWSSLGEELVNRIEARYTEGVRKKRDEGLKHRPRANNRKQRTASMKVREFELN